MKEPVVLFNATTGVNNKVDATAVVWSAEATELVRGVNVRVTDAGKLESLAGGTQVSALDFHSFYVDEEYNLLGTGGDVYRIQSDDTLLRIGQNFDGTPLRCQRFAGKVFVQTDTDAAVYDGSFGSWGLVVNADKLLDVELSIRPMGQRLSRFGDRLLVCKGSTVFASQPLNPYAFNLGYDWESVSGTITFCCEFEDELIVGTATETFAIRDAFTGQGKVRRLLPYGAFGGTEVIKVLDQLGKCLVFTTTDGVYAYARNELPTKLTPKYNLPEYSIMQGMVIPKTDFYYLVGGAV